MQIVSIVQHNQDNSIKYLINLNVFFLSLCPIIYCAYSFLLLYICIYFLLAFAIVFALYFCLCCISTCIVFAFCIFFIFVLFLCLYCICACIGFAFALCLYLQWWKIVWSPGWGRNYQVTTK